MPKKLSRRDALRAIAGAITAATTRPAAIGQVATTLFKDGLGIDGALAALSASGIKYGDYYDQMEIKLGKTLGLGSNSALTDADSNLRSVLEDMINFAISRGHAGAPAWEGYFEPGVNPLPEGLENIGENQLIAVVRGAFSQQEWGVFAQLTQENIEQHRAAINRIFAERCNDDTQKQARPDCDKRTSYISDADWVDAVHGRRASRRMGMDRGN